MGSVSDAEISLDASPGEAGPPSTAPPTARRSLALSSSGVFLASLAIQAIGVVASFFLYHNVNPMLLGIVLLYMIIASSITGIGDLRVGTAYVFFVARGQPPERSTGTYLAVRLAMVGAAGAALFFLGPLQGTTFTYAVGAGQIEILAVFMALPVLWSFQTVYTQLWIAKGDSLRGQYPLLLESLVRTPALVFIALHDPTMTGLTLAYLAGAVASTAYSLPTVLRYAHGFDLREAVRMFRYAWPLMGGLLLAYLAGNIPPFLVTYYLGSTWLPTFSAANGWRILALSLPAAVATPLFPHLSGLHRLKEYEAVRDGTWKALRYSAMIVIPGVVATVVYRTNLLYIFSGGGYARFGSTPLAILALAVVPATLAQIIGTSLNAIGKQRLELYLTSIQVAVLLVLAVALFQPFYLFGYTRGSPENGLIAACLAVLLSAIVGLVVNTYFMERLLAVRIQLLPVARMSVGAIASFFAVAQLNDFIPVNRYYELAGGLLLGFVAYFLVIALLGELTKEDVIYIGRSMGIPWSLTVAFSKVCWRHESPAVNVALPGAAAGLAPRMEDDFGKEGESTSPPLS
ncbi:MAG: oligosaccharide flippase family protein [Thermoplasmata archaeon]|nr:oligosaccharide flippase family protein [Thermoplasmata archaeon]